MKKITLKKYTASAIKEIEFALNTYSSFLNQKIILKANASEILYSELMQLEICLLLLKKIERKQFYESKHYNLKLPIQDAVCVIQAFIHCTQTSPSDYTKHIAEKTQEIINNQLINL